MFRVKRFYSQHKNAYNALKSSMKVNGKEYSYFSLEKLNDKRIDTLPYSIRVLLENSLRNNDSFVFTEQTTEDVLNWKRTQSEQVELPFKPSRVLLQDFTGVPAVVDLAAMRDAVKKLGADPSKINP